MAAAKRPWLLSTRSQTSRTAPRPPSARVTQSQASRTSCRRAGHGHGEAGAGHRRQVEEVVPHDQGVGGRATGGGEDLVEGGDLLEAAHEDRLEPQVAAAPGHHRRSRGR